MSDCPQITSKHTHTLPPFSSLASAIAIAVAVVAFVAFVAVADEVLGQNRSCNLYWDLSPLVLIVNWIAMALGVLKI